MPSLDPKPFRLDATYAAPGTLYACCRDAAGLIYGAGSDFAVYRVDPSIAFAEIPAATPAAGTTGKSDSAKKGPEPALAAEKLWTQHDSYVSSLLSLDGTIISAGFDRRIVWTDAATGRKIREAAGHDGWIRKLDLLPDRSRFVSAGDDMLVKLWDAASGELLRTFEGHAKLTPEGFATALYNVAVGPDGRHVAAADRVGDVCVWEIETGRLASRFKAPAFYTYDPVKRARSIGGVRSVAFHPDGERLALGGIGQVTNVDGFVGPCRVEVWDWKQAKSLYAGQDKHQGIFNRVRFHEPTSTLCAAGGGDGGPVLAFWDLKSEAPIHKVKPSGHIQDFVFDATGTQIYAAGFGGFQAWTGLASQR